MLMKFYEIIKEIKVDKNILRFDPWDTPILREQEHEYEGRWKLSTVLR